MASKPQLAPRWVACLFVAMPLVSSCTKDDGAKGKGRPPPLVIVQKVIARDVPVEVHAPVDLRPLEQADVGSKVLGYIDAVLVDRGDEVKQGQLVALVRPSDLPDQLAVARGTMAQTEASRGARADQLRAGAKARAIRGRDASKNCSNRPRRWHLPKQFKRRPRPKSGRSRCASARPAFNLRSTASSRRGVSIPARSWARQAAARSSPWCASIALRVFLTVNEQDAARRCRGQERACRGRRTAGQALHVAKWCASRLRSIPSPARSMPRCSSTNDNG